MQNRNRKMIYMVLIMLCATMSIFLILLENKQSSSPTSSEKKPVEYEISDGNITHKGPLIEDEESRIRNFHTDLSEAVDDNNFSSDGSAVKFSLKTEVKRLEDDENLILFGVFTQEDGADIFSPMKFHKKQENDIVKYSNPLFRIPIPYEFYKETESKKIFYEDKIVGFHCSIFQ